ncbi:molybdopterin-dependent oxidoreductase [Eggerthellaceae bacterium zg-1084]|uniref:Molybdopterin-dependent oxidoreductase n=1 Tax=Berryella wangjianweii TaxID=2734634 RepID=A0A6M8IXS0_9ACTN|nr:molybdopterin-dependent oxidoreductase [Berryella wangjianweii]NPD30903.1 molybdopterin-dependent oxidoreductase [Berryella wangjianweii]NPD31768.1 molybdopterin-dependent oxidoreductase [Eggerthellaceae bacterium zg-997]QKF07635.1 molybdopterin-dependent oxidoreductase [Berryella wangjianweii]
MSEHAFTRRSFLAAGAVATGLAATGGLVGCSSGGSVSNEATRIVHSLCGGCSSKCGFTAYVNDGKLTKQIGDLAHKDAAGKLCARGYGYANVAFSPDRLTDPLKRDEKGGFQKISWEQAYEEIAQKVADIVSASGPEALAMIHDPRPSGSYYAPRFMKALGSNNVYTHGPACYSSRRGGFKAVLGKNDWSSDVEHAKMTMFIGRSYADGIKPTQIMQLQRAHENGSKVVLVDPRCNNTMPFASEWVPIKPGTDLALVLALSHELVRTGGYAKDFVKENVEGFDEWWAYVRTCTPTWAEPITGIPADTISRLAADFAAAAPHASIESSWRAAFGCMYTNSGETGRAVAIFNTLLGCWNQKGGALFYPSVKPGSLDKAKFAPLPKNDAKPYGNDEFKLGPESNVLAAAEGARKGDLKGFFFYNSNMVAGYQNPAHLKECMKNLDLCVVIDVQMSETAQLADYVLPECSYLERFEVPQFIGGRVPTVSVRDQVLDLIHPNTKSCDRIFTELAEACGAGKYFTFTVEELAEAQLKSVGRSLTELRRVGTLSFADKEFSYGTPVKWGTKSGKIMFANPAVTEYGYSAVPQWIPPSVEPAEGQYRLIGGKQSVQSHNQSVNVGTLFEISREYGLERLWMHPSVAEKIGVKDGDTVEMSNDLASGKVRVKVTERMSPWAVYMPTHYGCTVKDQHHAYGFGLRNMDFTGFRIEPGYGGACNHENAVSLKKVNA